MKVTVYPFLNNGMVAVFDETGEQMPAYQGKRVDVEASIRRDFPDADWKEPFDFAAAAAQRRVAVLPADAKVIPMEPEGSSA